MTKGHGAIWPKDAPEDLSMADPEAKGFAIVLLLTAPAMSAGRTAVSSGDNRAFGLRPGYATVELAFLELMAPDLESAVHRLVRVLAKLQSMSRSSIRFSGPRGTPLQRMSRQSSQISRNRSPALRSSCAPARRGDDEGVIAALAAFCVAEARKD